MIDQRDEEEATHFGTSQYDFTRDKDEQDNLWFNHSIDKTREELQDTSKFRQ